MKNGKLREARPSRGRKHGRVATAPEQREKQNEARPGRASRHGRATTAPWTRNFTFLHVLDLFFTPFHLRL